MLVAVLVAASACIFENASKIEIISMLGEWRNVPPYGMRTAMIVNVCCMAMLPLLSLALLVMVVSEGHRGENRYGPDLNIPHP